MPASALIQATTSVMLQHGTSRVRILFATIALAEGEYAWTGSVEIADPADFQRMAINDPVIQLSKLVVGKQATPGRVVSVSGGRLRVATARHTKETAALTVLSVQKKGGVTGYM